MNEESAKSLVAEQDARWRRAAGTIGALGIVAGAFGAHALGTHPRIDVWKTAALYHVFHAIVLLMPAQSVATRLWFVAGIILFSGSLYALVLLNQPWLGMVTPLGGVCFMVGWLWLGWSKR